MKAKEAIAMKKILNGENLISPSQVSGLLPGINVVHQTVMKWIRVGCSGHKLESVKIGGRYYTSAEAVQRFLEAMNSSNDD